MVCLDIHAEKVAILNRKESLVENADLDDFLKQKHLNFRATPDK